jgi:hypothetical protein
MFVKQNYSGAGGEWGKVCLDEFPYLVNSSPELPGTIQRLTV